jgi:hypothetical protein
LVCSTTLPAQAQRGGGMGRGAGFSGDFGRGSDHWGHEFGREFGRWGYEFGPYRYWAFYGGLYGYPYSPYAYNYYPPTMYFVPPTYNVPSVTYFPVPVPVQVPSTTTPSTTTYSSGYSGAAVSPPTTGFTTDAAPRPSYPGFVPRPSTGGGGYYPDAPER